MCSYDDISQKEKEMKRMYGILLCALCFMPVLQAEEYEYEGLAFSMESRSG